MELDRHSLALAVLLVSALLVTLVIHGTVLERFYPDESFAAGLTLVAGWTSFALVFYAAGRLRTDPKRLPAMRGGDIGLALFLVSVLLALAMDSFGISMTDVPVAYVPAAIGTYVGLAALGWAIGRRTEAINAMVLED